MYVIFQMPAAIADQVYFIWLRRNYNCQIDRLESAGEEDGVEAALRALG